MKWNELPNDVTKLKELYEKLKDKEMRLEADLAIKEHPKVEEAITKVALALSDVKKLDQTIAKCHAQNNEEVRKEVEALINRIAYLRNQLDSAETSLKDKTGKSAEKLVDLKLARDSSFQQLVKIFKEASLIFESHNLDLNKVVPSISDFIFTVRTNKEIITINKVEVYQPIDLSAPSPVASVFPMFVSPENP